MFAQHLTVDDDLTSGNSAFHIVLDLVLRTSFGKKALDTDVMPTGQVHHGCIAQDLKIHQPRIFGSRILLKAISAVLRGKLDPCPITHAKLINTGWSMLKMISCSGSHEALTL